MATGLERWTTRVLDTAELDEPAARSFVGDFAIMSTRVYPSAGILADRVGTFVSQDCPATPILGPLTSWAMADVYSTG